jgi:hypothetical protein
MKEKRKFPRHNVSLPCNVQWKDHEINGQITNLSLGGALISQVNAIPSVGATVIVEFQFDEAGKVVLEGEVTTRVVHNMWLGGLGRFGVEFAKPAQEFMLKLSTVLEIPSASSGKCC